MLETLVKDPGVDGYVTNEVAHVDFEGFSESALFLSCVPIYQPTWRRLCVRVDTSPGGFPSDLLTVRVVTWRGEGALTLKGLCPLFSVITLI